MRKKVPFTISLLVLTTVFAISVVFGADVASGKKVYTKYCAVCHGKSGKGDGTGGQALKPKPRNYTKEAFKQGCSPSELVNTIENGIKGTSMAGFKKQFKGSEAADVAAYILETFVPKETADKCKKKEKK